MNGATSWYDLIILGLAIIGVIVNVTSFVVLVRGRKNSMFFKLLKLLAASDLIVVLGGALLWGLPDLWHYYSLRLYPIIVPYVLPIMQIAMMISIYTTILMSFERYVRIGHTCRLKDCAYITDDNFKYYMITIILGPCIFYVPRFFELKTTHTRLGIDMTVDCEMALYPPKFNLSAFNDDTMEEISNNSQENFKPVLTSPFFEECIQANFSNLDYPKLLNVTKYMETTKIETTELKSNVFYDKIYCIGLNTLVASVFPLLSLLYLNIYTILALKSIGRETGAAVSSRTANTRHNLTVTTQEPNATTTTRRNSTLSMIIPRSWMKTSKTLKSFKTVVDPPPASDVQHTHEMKIDHNDSVGGGHKKAERWHQTSSTFEMSFLKKRREGEKQRQKINESNLTMRFVRETHSIEVVVSPQKNSHLKSTIRKRPSIPRLRLKDNKKFAEPGADNGRYLPEESSNSNYSGAGSGASGIQNQMRARSESQCEYSPQIRNTKQMLEKRGKLSPSYPKLQQFSKRREAKRSKPQLDHFRRRANSCPDEIKSLTENSTRSSDTCQEKPVRMIDFTEDIPGILINSPEAKQHYVETHEGGLRMSSNCTQTQSEAAAIRMSLLRSGEARLTRISLAIVWLFIFCHVWRLLPTIYEAVYPNLEWPNWVSHVTGISHSFIVFNSAVNFLLYTVL